MPIDLVILRARRSELAGRILSIGVFLLFLTILIQIGYPHIMTRYQYLTEGETTQALITSVDDPITYSAEPRPGDYTSGGKYTTRQAGYFYTVNGEAYNGEAELGENTRSGDRIEIYYLSSDPEDHQISSQNGFPSTLEIWMKSLGFFAFGIISAYMAFNAIFREDAWYWGQD